jgi:hypothetical protein
MWFTVEVSAWTMTMDALLWGFHKASINIPSEFAFLPEIASSLTILAVIAAVPMFTASLIRGGSAAGMTTTAAILTSAVAQPAKTLAMRYAAPKASAMLATRVVAPAMKAASSLGSAAAGLANKHAVNPAKQAVMSHAVKPAAMALGPSARIFGRLAKSRLDNHGRGGAGTSPQKEE